MTSTTLTAEAAYAAAEGNANVGHSLIPNVPIGNSAPFVCPYCSVNSQHLWGYVDNLHLHPSPRSVSVRPYRDKRLIAAECQTCSRETVFFDGKVIKPSYSPAPLPTVDMPSEVLADFTEAREIVAKSPRGAAALLRLVIQKLCPILGATKSDINGAIGELVADGRISPALQKALDTVRVVGNEAVHPGILDLNDDLDTATALFGLVNFIVEKAITEPKQIGELYQSLPAGKLAGIAQRDGSTT